MAGTDLNGLPEVGRDHGGGLDAACARWGGNRSDWLDLSTGINPVPYPVPDLTADAWTALPDSAAHARLVLAARRFWAVPDGMEIVPTPGASSPIALAPLLARSRADAAAFIPGPTYNEHAAAFRAAGWCISARPSVQDGATVLVHPNNPDGRIWQASDLPETGLLILDESFCDVVPEHSLLPLVAGRPDSMVLKSFGKFWGLAGLRLGFAIGAPPLIARLRDLIGPWAVSGPALEIGATALEDAAWAQATRTRLAEDAARLDTLMCPAGAACIGGTSLFRLYDTDSAEDFQARLAGCRIWSRRFSYSERWLRLGLPGDKAGWRALEAALS